MFFFLPDNVVAWEWNVE